MVKFFSRRTKRRRLTRDKSGATALEFAFVAPLLLLLLLGIIEMGTVYIADATLRMTTEQVAREVRTGQIQALALSKTQFRDHYCAALPGGGAGFLKCDTSLTLDVESFSNFGAAAYQPPIVNGNLNAFNNYDTGSPCSVVLLRAYYQWPVQTPAFLPFLVNLQPNIHLLTAASAFRNEPYNATVSGC